MVGGRLAKTTELVRSAASETCVHFKLAVGEGCVWPTPPSRLQWLASSPPMLLVDRRPVRGLAGRLTRVDGRNGQYQLYYGYAHRPILQSAIGGPPTRVGGWEIWAGREVAMGTAAAKWQWGQQLVRGRPVSGRRGKARRSQAVV